MRSAICLLLVVTLGLGVAGVAGQQDASPVKKLLLKVRPPEKNKLIFKVKNQTGVLVGDPTTAGATFNADIPPYGVRCLEMPAGGWTSNVAGSRFT